MRLYIYMKPVIMGFLRLSFAKLYINCLKIVQRMRPFKYGLVLFYGVRNVRFVSIGSS